ncbi:MAG: ASKHA domain-containing protein [Deltaproteobacteria bacterium]|nr:ASKHA domain-containing protein [Deltaproteobacteria bacterium]
MRLLARQPGHEDLTITVPDQTTIMEALGLAGLSLDAPCGGQGRCGKCLVEVQGRLSPPSPKEALILENQPGRRLACLTKGSGEVTVTLEPRTVFNAVKGLGWSAPYSLDPPFKISQVPERDRQDQRSAQQFLNLKALSPQVLQTIGLLEADRNLGQVLTYQDQILMAFPANQEPPPNLAVALDLGTTGLAVAVLDLSERKILAMETSLNPQTAIGADVISRITAAAHSNDDLLKLQELAISGLKDLLTSAAGPKLAPSLHGAVIAGNATMLHLLAGVNPKSLAQAPYRPIFTKSLDLSHLAARLGLAPWAKVLTAPSISAYVGGDITAGLLAIKLAQRPGTVMFIDIGTNGEIVLSQNGTMVATSCAAGPALEGMNISHGLRAISGAIDSFKLNPDHSPCFTTINQAPAIGICGSGLIDLCAELIKGGLIAKSGKLLSSENFAPHIHDGAYYLTDQVSFTQKDIRQVQLAKGAIAAAMKMLLERLKLTIHDLTEVIIAGSFGYHLRAENLLTLKLIPAGYQGPVTFVGNSSLTGAARLLLDSSAQEEIDQLTAQVEVIELGFDPKFQETFLAELSF